MFINNFHSILLQGILTFPTRPTMQTGWLMFCASMAQFILVFGTSSMPAILPFMLWWENATFRGQSYVSYNSVAARRRAELLDLCLKRSGLVLTANVVIQSNPSKFVTTYPLRSNILFPRNVDRRFRWIRSPTAELLSTFLVSIRTQSKSVSVT